MKNKLPINYVIALLFIAGLLGGIWFLEHQKSVHRAEAVSAMIKAEAAMDAAHAKQEADIDRALATKYYLIAIEQANKRYELAMSAGESPTLARIERDMAEDRAKADFEKKR